jgi:hypothetical protein
MFSSHLILQTPEYPNHLKGSCSRVPGIKIRRVLMLVGICVPTCGHPWGHEALVHLVADRQHFEVVLDAISMDRQ